MIEHAELEALKKLLGEENVLTEKEDRLCYSFDASMNTQKMIPAVVVLPKSAEEVSGIVKFAAGKSIPVFPRGAGTNLSGGTIPVEEGIVISFCRMDDILEIDSENLTATIQPGVVIEDLCNAADKYGLLYAPDPGTVHCATMGGSIGECAGGLRGLKYGVTKDYVMGVEVVFADGSIARFGGKTVKNVSGYNMTQLFVGSEGTLGLITEAIVRLIPKPKARRSMMAVFFDLEKAGVAVSEIIKSHIIPATLEIMDGMTIRCVEETAQVGLPVGAEAVLLIEVDGNEAQVAEDAEKAAKICEECGADSVRTAKTDAQRDGLWAARRAALPALVKMAPTTILEDATVPRSKVPDMLRAIKEIAQKYSVKIGTFGHAGDGNLHPTLLADEGNEEEMKRVHAAIDEIFAAALNLGGTLSGEHGIGLAKLKYMEDQFGETGLAAMLKVKKAFDPQNILNPGKLIPRGKNQ
jgi:glycolate oxidase